MQRAPQALQLRKDPRELLQTQFEIRAAAQKDLRPSVDQGHALILQKTDAVRLPLIGIREMLDGLHHAEGQAVRHQDRVAYRDEVDRKTGHERNEVRTAVQKKRLRRGRRRHDFLRAGLLFRREFDHSLRMSVRLLAVLFFLFFLFGVLILLFVFGFPVRVFPAVFRRILFFVRGIFFILRRFLFFV